jgi:hypothetical protein
VSVPSKLPSIWVTGSGRYAHICNTILTKMLFMPLKLIVFTHKCFIYVMLNNKSTISENMHFGNHEHLKWQNAIG